MNSVFDVSLEGIMITNGEGRVEFVNAAACGMFDRLPDEFIGKNVLQFVQPEDREGEDGNWAATETGYRVVRTSDVLNI
ncbi:MAG: PAS domain-containing protein, partial [Rhodospirillaceae bacterium]|nr:PAS domain-containing protein [Rhodospirillaceae bacterium]